MRKLLAVTVLLGAASAFDRAAAAEYPWCVHYNMNGEARNCGFVSWEQCMQTARGAGGSCLQNPFYFAPPTERSRLRKPRQN